MPDSLEKRLLALLAKDGRKFSSAAQVKEEAEQFGPVLVVVLGELRATPATWAHVCDFVTDIETLAPEFEGAAKLLSPTDATTKARNQSAFALSSLRDQKILKRLPAGAAFADGVAHLAELWADLKVSDPENDPLDRGRAASRALVTALVLAQGREETDKPARTAASTKLLKRLRAALR